MSIQKLFVLTLCAIICASFGFSATHSLSIKDLSAQYIQAWKKFYPSSAYSRGFLETIFEYEDMAQENIQAWMSFNDKVLAEIKQQEKNLVLEDRIDARLLRIQIRNEQDKWQNEAPHLHSPLFYARLISGAVDRIARSPLVSGTEKGRLIQKRMAAIDKLCDAAIVQLQDKPGDKDNRALDALQKTVKYMESSLSEQAQAWIGPGTAPGFKQACSDTAANIRRFYSFIKQELSTASFDAAPTILGREIYARRLKIYTDSELTPEQLESMALEEIHKVRELMAGVAADYLDKGFPGLKLDTDINKLINRALKDMEQDYPASNKEYLKLWQELTQRAEKFIRDKKIVTLPENPTLSIKLAPESAGRRARIGWVSPAPAFTPDPWTTIYLPNVPDTFPDKERQEFWRSFNNYFTRFIVIHELYPGHYIQGRINRENPHPVRKLFPYPLYAEGWATLCEQVALSAGWDNGNKLTWLAHLRKRLENANRAYTSVQVHCNGWDQEEVWGFSTETSLLAPQFAKSLWFRLLSSPLYITTYFLGTREFTEIWEKEKKRQGKNFSTLVFMDTILRAGPIPLDEFQHIFAR